ncbi:tRNA(Ile)-lysidine synthetase, partial [Staphylococcus haemolyticus]
NQLDDIAKMILLDQLLEQLHLNKAFSEKQDHEWFHQISNQIAQFEISLTENWIIQIAYDQFIILAKNEPSLLDNQIVTDA